MAQVFAQFNDKKVKAFMTRLGKNVKDQRKIAKVTSPIVFKDVIQHFEKEKGETGRWKPWSASYRKHMNAIGKGGNKKLQDSGRLRQSFLLRNFRTTKDFIVWYNAAKTKKGFPYAAAHDRGGPQLPQRQFMWASKKAMNLMAKAILDQVVSDK